MPLLYIFKLMPHIKKTGYRPLLNQGSKPRQKQRNMQVAQRPEPPKAEPARTEDKDKTPIKQLLTIPVTAKLDVATLEVPKWTEEVGLPKNLSSRQGEAISRPISEIKEEMKSVKQTSSSFVPPAIEIMLRMALSLGGVNSASPAEVEAYNQQLAKMSHRITLGVAIIANRIVSNLTNLVFNPVSVFAKKIITNKNFFLIYQKSYFTLSQLIIEAMLVQSTDLKNSNLIEIKTTSYLLTELLWHRTGGLPIDASLLSIGILEKPLYNVILNKSLGDGSLSNLIKLAIKKSIKRVSALSISRAVEVVMQKLKKLIQDKKNNV